MGQQDEKNKYKPKLDEYGGHKNDCECCECYGHPEEGCADDAELLNVDDEYCTFESICPSCGGSTILEYTLNSVESS